MKPVILASLCKSHVVPQVGKALNLYVKYSSFRIDRLNFVQEICPDYFLVEDFTNVYLVGDKVAFSGSVPTIGKTYLIQLKNGMTKIPPVTNYTSLGTINGYSFLRVETYYSAYIVCLQWVTSVDFLKKFRKSTLFMICILYLNLILYYLILEYFHSTLTILFIYNIIYLIYKEIIYEKY